MGAGVGGVLGRVVCFTQSTDPNVSLIQKPRHRHTQSHVKSSVWAPGARSGHVKRTTTIPFVKIPRIREGEAQVL